MNDQIAKTLADKLTTLELAIRASEQVNLLKMTATTPENKKVAGASAYEAAVLLDDARADFADYIVNLVNGEQNVN